MPLYHECRRNVIRSESLTRPGDVGRQRDASRTAEADAAASALWAAFLSGDIVTAGGAPDAVSRSGGKAQLPARSLAGSGTAHGQPLVARKAPASTGPSHGAPRQASDRAQLPTTPLARHASDLGDRAARVASQSASEALLSADAARADPPPHRGGMSLLAVASPPRVPSADSATRPVQRELIFSPRGVDARISQGSSAGGSMPSERPQQALRAPSPPHSSVPDSATLLQESPGNVVSVSADFPSADYEGAAATDSERVAVSAAPHCAVFSHVVATGTSSILQEASVDAGASVVPGLISPSETMPAPFETSASRAAPTSLLASSESSGVEDMPQSLPRRKGYSREQINLFRWTPDSDWKPGPLARRPVASAAERAHVSSARDTEEREGESVTGSPSSASGVPAPPALTLRTGDSSPVPRVSASVAAHVAHAPAAHSDITALDQRDLKRRRKASRELSELREAWCLAERGAKWK